MKTVTVKRETSLPYATIGKLSCGDFSCVTLERPWLKNAPEISCIPVGTYPVLWVMSPRHGKMVYQLQNVDARSGIEIDIANVAEQLLGCLALGLTSAQFKKDALEIDIPSSDQIGIIYSADTVAAFEKQMRDENGNQENFLIEIS